jgi:hypothetical protein
MKPTLRLTAAVGSFVLLAVCAVMLCLIALREREACCLRCRISRTAGLEKLDVLRELGSQLTVGMDPTQVAAIMGLPENDDRRDVWLWVCDAQPHAGSRRQPWRPLILSTTAPRPFLLFDDQGRLITPHVVAPGDPWEAYQIYTHRNDRDRKYIEERLGKNPWWKTDPDGTVHSVHPGT